ncbi:acyltransferase family protein [Candidatus Dojkabacteria bacterium]|nr:acyltransferase family protein [Candidatus Dojkabacteria bacterium]
MRKRTSPQKRELSFDILRGIAVFLMILAHTIAFFDESNSSLLNFLQKLGDTVCFTTFLLVSGSAVYYSALSVTEKDWKKKKRKFFNRIIKLLLGYYFAAIISSLKDFPLPITTEWLKNIFEIIFFVKVPGYTEFLLPFIFYSLLVIVFRKKIGALIRSKYLALSVGIISYLLGHILYHISLPSPLTYYKALVAGESNWYRFPILQYLGIFLIGILLGQLLKKTKTLKTRVQNLSIITLISIIFLSLFTLIEPLSRFPLDEKFQRWPPSVGFILIGLSFAITIIFLIQIKIKNFTLEPLKEAIIFLGSNAFSLFIYHILILQITEFALGIRFPQVSEVLASFVVLITASAYFVIYSEKAKIGLEKFKSIEKVAKLPKLRMKSHRKKPDLLKEKYFLLLFPIIITSILTAYIGIRQLVNTDDPPDIQNLFSPEIKGVATTNIGEPELIASIERKWILKGTTGNNEKYSKLNYTLEVKNVDNLDLPPKFEIQGTTVTGELQKNESGLFTQEIDLASLEVGTYEMKTSVLVNGKNYETEKISFNLSYPVYVIWTIDWEGSDTKDEELAEIVDFTQKHNNLPISHMFNPRIYVSDKISSERAEQLTSWIIKRKYAGDEIALHLHMHREIIEASQVTFRTQPKWTDYINDGHDVPCYAYTYPEFMKILAWSKKKFSEKGLGTPTSFRAGGWSADENTLKALQDSGFLIDTSGRDFIIWGSKSTKLQSPWNLKSTTQPFKPSVNNQNSPTPPTLNLWEFPNNGADTYLYRTEDLIKRFQDNFTEGIQKEFKVVTYLSHAHAFSEDRKILEPAYEYIDLYNVKSDSGPVIYTTLAEAYNDITK